MSEEAMPSVTRHAPTAITPRATARAVQLAGRGARAAVRPEHLTSSTVRVLDLASLSFSLLIAVLSVIVTGPVSTAQAVMAHRIRFTTVLIEIGLLICWRVLFWVMSLYQPRLISGFGSLLWRVPLTVVPCTAVLIPVLAWRMPDLALAQSCFTFWLFGTTLMLTIRAAVFSYDELVRPRLRKVRSVVICGTGVRARMLALELAHHADFRYQVLGFVDSTPQNDCADIGPLLGKVNSLESLLMKLPVDEVIVALPVKSHFSEIEQIVEIAGAAGVQLQYSLDLFTTVVAKNRAVEPGAAGSRMVLEMVNQDSRMFLKNLVDRSCAGLGLLLLSPVMLGIAVAIRMTSKGPIFFVQQRYGLNKRKFGMIKFRSMVVDAEARMKELEHKNMTGGPMFKMKNDPRITGIGKLIRRTSLDELPQLINVLRGEMSLVGPRPLPQRDIDHFSEAWLMRRFSVKPGITGLWQVSGRSNTDFDSAIKLDLKYIDKWSIAMDMRILMRTLAAVVRGSGAY